MAHPDPNIAAIEQRLKNAFNASDALLPETTVEYNAAKSDENRLSFKITIVRKPKCEILNIVAKTIDTALDI